MDTPKVFNESEIQTIIINTNISHHISFNKWKIDKIEFSLKKKGESKAITKIELSPEQIESIQNIGKKDFLKF